MKHLPDIACLVGVAALVGDLATAPLAHAIVGFVGLLLIGAGIAAIAAAARPKDGSA